MVCSMYKPVQPTSGQALGKDTKSHGIKEQKKKD